MRDDTPNAAPKVQVPQVSPALLDELQLVSTEGKSTVGEARVLHICGFRHIRDNKPKSQKMTFDELAHRLETPQVLKGTCRTPEKCGDHCLGKCRCPGVTGAKFTGKRSKANVKELHFLCLDFDNDGDSPLPIPEIEWALDEIGARYIIHTTLSHTDKRPKFRVLLDLAKPVPAHLYEQAMAWALEQMIVGGVPRVALFQALDKMLLKGSHVHQMYLIPAHRDGTPAPYYRYQGEGAPLAVPLDHLEQELARDNTQKEQQKRKDASRRAATPWQGKRGKISEEILEEIRQRVDLIEVVEQYTELRQAGSEYVGLCPLHEEDSPSFSVNADKGVFHCFGCNAGGDVFKFLELKTSQGFLEVVRDLANRYGVALPEIPQRRQTRSRSGKVLELVSRRSQEEGISAGGEAPLPDILTHRKTDLANAEWFLGEHGVNLRYCHPWGRWLVWSDKHWILDEAGEAARLAKGVTRTMYEEAQKFAPLAHDRDSGPAIKSLLQWVKTSQMGPRIRSMLEIAQSEEGIPVSPDALDQDIWMLNVANGTLDLQNGELRPHRHKDLITKLLPVAYDPAALCPRWHTFLNRAMGEDQDLINYLKRVIGYSLTGAIQEQCFFFLYGTGANGKSTFLDTIRHLMGDYAQHMPTEALLTKTYATSGPTPELARLKGVRYATAVEAEAGRRLAESLIKQMTGGEPLAARFNRQDTFEFMPTHKLFLAANHRPEIRGTDHAIWRRVHTIPFEVTIPDNEKDPRLSQKLKAELPGILAWAVEGCQEWGRMGLRVPKAVLLATEEYRGDMDILGDFLEERCLISEHVRARNAELYGDYEKWSEQERRHAVTQKTFSMRLQERGFRTKRTRQGRWWLGIGLRDNGIAT
jgi:putative DNA primase/helicase